MDLKHYGEARANGGVTITRNTDKACRVAVRQYSPSTGEELSPIMEDHDISEVKRQAVAAQEQLDRINAFLADLESTPIAEPVKPK